MQRSKGAPHPHPLSNNTPPHFLPHTQMLHAWHRPSVRAAAVQAFCNLSYACVESLEPAHRMGGVLEAVGEGLRALITAEGVRDGQYTACQVCVCMLVCVRMCVCASVCASVLHPTYICACVCMNVHACARMCNHS